MSKRRAEDSPLHPACKRRLFEVVSAESSDDDLDDIEPFETYHSSDLKCDSCLEPFFVAMLPRCSHVFHNWCLRHWIQSVGGDVPAGCPVCRKLFRYYYLGDKKVKLEK